MRVKCPNTLLVTKLSRCWPPNFCGTWHKNDFRLATYNPNLKLNSNCNINKLMTISVIHSLYW